MKKENLIGKMEDVEDIIAEIQPHVIELEQKRFSLEREINNQQNEMDELCDKLASVDDELNAMRRQLTRLKLDRADIERQLESAEDEDELQPHETHIVIGQGKVIHLAQKSTSLDGNVMYFTHCGSDHATNRSMRRYRIVKGEVTCKKCLALMESIDGRRIYEDL